MLKLSDYDYTLPPERIAQSPVSPRDSCRLLVLDRKSGVIRHDIFRNIGTYLSQNDLLVLNNTRVMPARVFGSKKTGGKVEFLLLREEEKNLWECLVRPGRRLPTGTEVFLSGKRASHAAACCKRASERAKRLLALHGNGLRGEIVNRSENGTRLVKFSGTDDIRNELNALGKLPLPPYVTNPTCDLEAYQTVYAKTEGSVAAPTAGLHFTEELLASLVSRGILKTEITLHVGWGTFRPVRSETITDHQMEKEWFSISRETADALNQTKEKRIVAVGTTSCRVLEGLPKGEIKPISDWSNLFIYPGFEFKRVGALMTNFHLPRSTLLMLVCAFAGRGLIFKAYQEAIQKDYRFYSFGDAMLII